MGLNKELGRDIVLEIGTTHTFLSLTRACRPAGNSV